MNFKIGYKGTMIASTLTCPAPLRQRGDSSPFFYFYFINYIKPLAIT